MTDTAAAMGLVQLERAKEMHRRRYAIASRYRRAFSYLEQFELLETESAIDHAWHLFVMRLTPETWTVGRDEVICELARAGVQCSVHFIPLHLHPFYRDTFGYQPDDFPAALDCYERSISLPLYSAMSDEDVDRVIETVTDVARRFER